MRNGEDCLLGKSPALLSNGAVTRFSDSDNFLFAWAGALARTVPASRAPLNKLEIFILERLHADVQRRDQCARKDQPCKVLREESLTPGMLKFCIYLKTNHARGNKLETVIAHRSSSPHHCFVHRSDTHAYTSSPHGRFPGTSEATDKSC